MTLEEMIEDQAYLPGSMIDQLVIARRELAEFRAQIELKKQEERKKVETLTLLNSINFLLALFREDPSLSDTKCAKITNTTIENTKLLRAIVNEDIRKKVEKAILETIFDEMPVLKEDKERLGKSIAKFYSKITSSHTKRVKHKCT